MKSELKRLAIQRAEGQSRLNDGLGLHTCQECGMQTEIAAYHPYAACLMFKSCHDSGTVQANLDSVIAHGYQSAYEAMTPEILRPNVEVSRPRK
jgi:hypothetical protein